jgi:serine/threonine protein kinase
MADTPESQHPAGGPAPQPPTVVLSTPDLTSHQSTLEEVVDTARELPAPPGDSAVPIRAFGDFELLQEIGRGAMGIVYQARERHSRRLVALKMMMLEQPGRGGGNRRRFALEARATGQLSHPGIVTIHAWGEHDGQPFYTMDYVPGTLLSRILEDGPLPCERAVHFVVNMARAVAAAHALGIVHRDLKPGNVIIDSSDQPRVLDFGLAKRLSSAAAATPPSLDSVAEVVPSELAARKALSTDKPAEGAEPRAGARATEQGAVLGTPAYMAPEQAIGDHSRVGPATDVHALGAIFYEMLTGRPPFQAATVLEILKKVSEREPPPLRSWGLRVPPPLEAVCVRALRKDPQDRYPDAHALADDLEQRWQKCLLGPRFARLTGLAFLALALLTTLWLTTRWLGLDPLAAAFSAAGSEPTGVAAALCHATLFFGGGLLALGAALSWLGAWALHTDRAAPMVAVACALAAAAWGSTLLATTEGIAADLSLGMASVLSLAAAVAFGSWYLREAAAAARNAGPDGPAPKPFMQRLIAASAKTRRAIEDRQDQVSRVTSPVHVGLGDFELGKVLHRWARGRIQRGRQTSLDRPVLIWLETGPAPEDQAQSGVLVRHLGLLGLYAVGSGPEGRFLVTEPSPATPLADLLARSPLTPLQAIRLGTRLARVVEAYHAQGACHGRLSLDWILVRAELEPVLCPCGVPCRSDQDRRRDIQALGEVLLGLLPGRPGRGKHRLVQIGEAARRGDYARAVDVAEDLDRAGRVLRNRWRGRLTMALLWVFATLPWLALAALGDAFAAFLLAALAPSCVLLGYSQARTLVGRHRLQRRLLQRSDLGKGLVPLLLFMLPAGLLAAAGWPVFPGNALSGALATADLLGCWLAGICVAGLVTAAEAVYATLQTSKAAS